ncbi:hypothetical protein [Tomitella fengzijianii]|uniref:hypothetical protein n=1 Tax=Tomitella fengzijianii TaxID=2597660 RepID=UPI00131A73E0|nr:hypothetical protein [Tomitella fengzijianii]
MVDTRPVFRRWAVVAGVTVAAVLAASGPAVAGPVLPGAPPATVTLQPAGAVREVPTDFFGVNGARIISPENAEQWHDPVFRQALAGVDAGLIRVQGGTTSQWIDWRTGRFIQRPGGEFPGQNEGRNPILLSDWADVVRATGATPIFDLNVLTSTVDEQIAMLHEAQRLGMDVRYVELGNELWDPGSYYREVYPTGADYARAMNEWIVRLRQEFPDIKIGVSGADDSSIVTVALGPRIQTWNAGLYANIRGADAVVLHPYWTPDPVQADIGSTAAGGVAAWNSFADKAIGGVPAGMEVWITEYNQINIPFGEIPGFPPQLISGVPQTWAVGLSVAGFALSSLTDPRVRMSVLHAAIDGLPSARSRAANGNEEIHALLADGSGGSIEYGRTALNEALTPIYTRGREGGTVQRITADGAPEVTVALGTPLGITRVTSIVGAEFLGDHPGAFLVNLGNQPVHVRMPDALSGTLTADTLTAPPLSNPAFTPSDHVTETRTEVTGEATLPPYSLTQLTPR